ncbi:MAG: type II secretion system protein [Patescibacteria group bacterium]
MKKGFTLIELMMVIAIIGILSAVVLTSLNNSRIKGYDSKIKQQLLGFRRAAEIYFTNQSPLSYGSPVLDCVSGMFADTSAVNGNPNAYLQITGINPAPTIVCGATASQYAVKASLPGGGGWCVDYKGTSKSILAGQVAGSATFCP